MERRTYTANHDGYFPDIGGTNGADHSRSNALTGAAMNKGLTFKMGQTHVQKYMPKLFELIESGEIDPSTIITHRMSLEDAPHAYDIFNDKEDECVKVVLKPGMPGQTAKH